MWLSLGTLRSLCISRANGNWLSQIEKHVVVSRLLSDYWEGVRGKVICIQQSFLNQNLDLPPPQWKILGSPPAKMLLWVRSRSRLMLACASKSIFSSYIRGSLVGRKTFYLCIMKIVLIMCILEEQEAYLLRAVSNHLVSCGSVVPCVETSPLKANNRDWALRKPMN